ncbi:MAG: TCP-1/cpn60 chaperonin family protein [Bacillota bacterium]
MSELEYELEKLSALENNTQAIKTVVSAVAGTLGPKGLDCMIVNDEGDFIVTNDGVTILSEMEATHPAAIMMVQAAYAQETDIGDGTTTMTVMAGQLLESALHHAHRGVPIHKIIEGIKLGVEQAINIIQTMRFEITEQNFDFLKDIALIAGRGEVSIGEAVFHAANLLKAEKLRKKNFKFPNVIEAHEGTENRVIHGVIVDRKPLSHDYGYAIHRAKLLILDDAMEQEQLCEESLSTENGFQQYIENRKQMQGWVEKILELKVNAIFCCRGIDEQVQQLFTDASVFVVDHTPREQLKKLALHTGGKAIKRSVLNKTVEELEYYCGNAAEIFYDDKLEYIGVLEGSGEEMVTVLISASTGSVTKEMERVATDAAAALQAAVKGGIVPGGGVTELACAIKLQEMNSRNDSLAKYGVECVVECLKKPIYHIVKNAGFQPLEKIEKLSEQIRVTKNNGLGINCDTGEIENMLDRRIVDPALVKVSAIKTASEIAQAILKINTILKGRL